MFFACIEKYEIEGLLLNVRRNLISYGRSFVDKGRPSMNVLLYPSLSSKSSSEKESSRSNEMPSLRLLVKLLSNSLTQFKNLKKDQDKYSYYLQHASQLDPEEINQVIRKFVI